MVLKKSSLYGRTVQAGMGSKIVFARHIDLGAVVPRADNQVRVTFCASDAYCMVCMKKSTDPVAQ